MGTQQIFKRNFPCPLLAPAPFLLRWAHFNILRDGCPYCGGRDLEFLKGEMGPLEPLSNFFETSGKNFLLPIKWEDISYQCKSCQKTFIYRFFSSQTSQQGYENLLRSHLRDLIAFFAKEKAESTTIPNYVEFEYWFKSLLEAIILEGKVKGIPLIKWLLEEMRDLILKLTAELKKSDNQEFILKQIKLLTFAVQEILPRVLK